MYERLQQRLAETANAAPAVGAAGAAAAANARPRRLSIGTNGAGLGALPAPPAALVAPAVAAGMARAPLSLYPFPSSAFGAAAPMPAPVPAVASTGVAPSPSLPASASTSAHHAALICNTCSRAPVKNSSFNAATGQIVQAVTLARCSGCRAVYYCSKSCQKLDWQKHKFLCRSVRTMDQHGLTFLKISSTVPGNFHRPAVAATPPGQDACAGNGAPLANGCPSRKETNALGPNSNDTPAACGSSPAALPEAAAADGTAAAAAASSSCSNSNGRIRSKRARTASRAAPPSSSGPSPFDFPSAAAESASAAAAADGMSDLLVAGSSSCSSGADNSSDSEEECADPLRVDSSSAGGSGGGGGRRRKKRRKRHDGDNGRGSSAAASSSHASSSVPPALQPDASPGLAGEPPLHDPDGDVPALGVLPVEAPLVPLQLQPIVLPPPNPAAPLSLASVAAAAATAATPAAIAAAYGPRPRPGQACLVHYQCRYSNGAIFAKSRHVFFHGSSSAAAAAAAAGSGSSASLAASLTPSTLEWVSQLGDGDTATPLRFVVGAGEVIQCWDECVRSMFKGEGATILTRDENRQLFVHELQLVDFGDHL